MKQAKISLRLKKLTDGQLEDLALAAIAGMTDNKNFTEPKPSVADLKNSTQLFSDSLALAKSRDMVKVAKKNELRETLELLLTNMANYCTYIAEGNRSILGSSGFPLRAETSTPRTLGYPENFRVELGNNSGEVLLYVNNVANVKSYLFLYSATPGDEKSWQHVIDSQPWYTIGGLTPGAIYMFKIGAAGARGQVLYTRTISQVVL